ncbi:Flp pilus assembly protein TadD [Sphingomonas sp. SORGH_AS870]|nr:Flp pilus assembly protein TadD [Sphingomonas sp. SORGH_AS_0789]MDR6147436.1 Flp pilus assembly protein TadD [Sphingomonas sp. SORGH_AS_0870]MDR6151221.1 Flp pilus assembly protein TadD [Sphingomonas sp. SORGH_AS_0742]
MRGMSLALIVAAAGMAAPAIAQDRWPQRTGYQEIAAGKLVAAERTLLQERRASPDSPELMLNLAAVYAQTGRASEARSLYAAVLQEKPIAMDMPSGAVISSHRVAETGLRQLNRTFASR